jgi:ribosomal protein L7Ae-like RNA K-turn-binding protein
MIIAKNIEVSIFHGNLQKFLKNETLPKIVAENVNKLGNYCHKKKEASMIMKTFAYNQLQEKLRLFLFYLFGDLIQKKCYKVFYGALQ